MQHHPTFQSDTYDNPKIMSSTIRSELSDVAVGIVRPVLRKASVILPFTGERIYVSDFGRTTRNFTLRRVVSVEDADGPNLAFHDTTPLIPRSRAASVRAEGGAWRQSVRRLNVLFEILGNKNSRMIFKCSIAYLVGSLATFVAPISAVLGKSDGKHMVATIAVYFHPARTSGSMFEAMIYAFTALFYSTFISISSMAVSCFFDDIGFIKLGHAIVLVVFCAGGLGVIGWVKQKMSIPTFSVACSLAAISIITILTKEGTVQIAQFSMSKILQVAMIVLMAIITSTTVSYVLWPSSAIKELRVCMAKSTKSFSDMITMITRAFLNGSESELESPAFSNASTEHRTVFTALAKHLTEAKYEHYVRGSERGYQLDKKLVDCMQRLAQHIGGLRSAAKSQFSLLHGHVSNSLLNVRNGSLYNESIDARTPSTPSSPPAEDISLVSSSRLPGTPQREETCEQNISAPTPATIFEEFIYHLGPPMKSLVYTLKAMLDNLPFSTDLSPGFSVEVNPQFRESLVSAIELYSETRSQALNCLYQNLKGIPRASGYQCEAWMAEVEEVAGYCGYFSYCLLDFAKEMIVFLDILEEMQDYQCHTTRSWSWLKFWKYWRSAKGSSLHSYGPIELPPPPDLLKSPQRRKTIPNIARDKPIPFSYKIWKALSAFRRDDVKFGIKVGGGAAIYALPAFIPATRPTFSSWRGEWGLVSYMIVISMTIGQTNTSGFHRVLGTVIGASLAILAWVIAPKNPYVLPVIGWAISLPCFHIILNWKQSTFGRFILLTYNITCLYAYSLSAADNDSDDDDEGGINPIITTIARHRVVSVAVGVAWGIFVSRYIWPVSARKKLRRGLSILWLRLALIWKRSPLDSLIDGESEKPYMNITEEHALQQVLLRLPSLVSQAKTEFRLKGPFPIGEYQNLIAANQSILDACHGLTVMMRKNPRANEREADILNYTAQERKDLCARIAHLFYVLASSIQLGFPLLETLPNTDKAKDRLLAKLFSYREKIKGQEGQFDEDFALLYAYVLVVGRIIEGLQECIQNVSQLYGVLEEEMLEI